MIARSADADAAEELLTQAQDQFSSASEHKRASRPELAVFGFAEGLKLLQRAEALAPLPVGAFHLKSMAFGALGDQAWAKGHFAEARRHYVAKLQVARHIRKSTRDSLDALHDVSLSLGRLGEVTELQGRFAKARRLYEAKLDLSRRVLARLDQAPSDLLSVDASHEPVSVALDRRVALRDVGVSHGRLGDLARALGDIEEAMRSYETQLKYFEQAQAQRGHGQLVRDLRDLSVARERLGATAASLGRLADAKQHFEIQLLVAQQIRALVGDTAEGLRDVSISLGRLGDLALELGRRQIADAQCHYEAKLQITHQILAITPDAPEALRDVSISFGRLGDIAAPVLNLPAAKRHFESMRERAQQVRSRFGDSYQSLRDEGYSIGKLGDIAIAHGDIAEAKRHYDAHGRLALRALDLTGETPPALRDLSVALDRLSALALAEGKHAEAADLGMDAAVLAIEASVQRTAVALEDLAALSRRLAGTTSFTQLGPAIVWPLHARMLRFVLGYCEFNQAESIERARSHLEAFHVAWLGLALSQSSERIPEVLGAAQGRKVTTLALLELHRQANDAEAAEVPEYRFYFDACQRVHALSLQLGGVPSSVASEATSGLSGDFSKAAEVSKQRAATLQVSYDAALAAHIAARDALIAVRADLIDIKPADVDRFRLKTLQQRLQENAALLLLIDAPPDAARPHRAHALFIPKEGAPVLKPLPELDTLPFQLHAYRRSLSRGDRAGAYRDCSGWTRAPADEGAKAAVTPIDAATALKERLWSNFESELRLGRVKHLHVVSHGDLHNLPLSLGAPEGLTISQYPGLVYYWMVHNRHAGTIVVDTSRPLSAKVYTPQTLAKEGLLKGMAPIPHVLTEYALAASCWKKQDELLYERLAGPPATLMHIACHGTLEREGQEDPCLILGPYKALNLIELLNGEKSSPIVYLSACLVGQTKEDIDGDPLGLVGAFMIRGAKVVIAALNPINDFWAPLLAYLFHRTLQAHSKYQGQLDPVQALEDAKGQVRSGKWFPKCVLEADRKKWEQDSAEAVVQTYAPQVQKQLQDALTLEGCEGLAQDWAQLDKICLVDEADWVDSIMSDLAKTGLGSLVPETEDFVKEVLKPELLAKRKQGPNETASGVPAGARLMEQVVLARAQLHEKLDAIRWLLQDMQAFGAVGRSDARESIDCLGASS